MVKVGDPVIDNMLTGASPTPSVTAELAVGVLAGYLDPSKARYGTNVLRLVEDLKGLPIQDPTLANFLRSIALGRGKPTEAGPVATAPLIARTALEVLLENPTPFSDKELRNLAIRVALQRTDAHDQNVFRRLVALQALLKPTEGREIADARTARRVAFKMLKDGTVRDGVVLTAWCEDTDPKRQLHSDLLARCRKMEKPVPIHLGPPALDRIYPRDH